MKTMPFDMSVELLDPAQAEFAPRSVVEVFIESDDDDLGAELKAVCTALRVGAKFVVRGFGQDPWRVDISTDLPIVLEQLLPLLDAVVEWGDHVDLDFFEQGVERYLHFRRDGHLWRITCVSFSDWTPAPSEVSMSANQIVALVENVLAPFVAAVAKSKLDVSRLSEFQRWSRTMVGKLFEAKARLG